MAPFDRNRWHGQTEIPNTIILPGSLSPERVLAKMLNEEKDVSEIWSKICLGYTKQICFRDVTIEEIRKDREKAKEWFKNQMQYWGRGCSKVINVWIEKNPEEYALFLKDFEELINRYTLK